MAETQLVHYEQARRELALASSLDEVKMIRDQAEAIRQYIKQQKGSFEMQNQAAEIKLRAERRAGEMLRDSEKNTGAMGIGKKVPLHDAITLPTPLPTYKELGIEATQAMRWQAEAEIPEERFEQFIAETKARAEELTSRATLSMAMKMRNEQKKQTTSHPDLPEGLFSVIVIDPPWPYGGDYDPESHRVASPYPEMSIDDLMVLTIPAADDCVLWLWTTNAFMHDAYHLLEAWAFEPKTILTWVKNKMGVGYWLRGQTEHCLMAIKGKPNITLTNQTTYLLADNKGHSTKPDVFYRMVEGLCAEEKRIDMFARSKKDGWENYGNQIS